ncbi:MAG: hypothetical protein KDI71_18185 [Xanthomonadales bacterium]|nr:hypothetical protein [Xanthomonadales bacterium]
MSSNNREQQRRRRERARAAMSQLEARRMPLLTTVAGVDPWSRVLGELDRVILDVLRFKEKALERHKSVYAGAWAVLNRGTMLRDPASGTEIEALETRLELDLRPVIERFSRPQTEWSCPWMGNSYRLLKCSLTQIWIRSARA